MRTPASKIRRLRQTCRLGIALLSFWLLAVPTVFAGPPPNITTQPTNQTVLAGGTATFVVAATSGSTLTYQWYFQSFPIPGATGATYVLNTVQVTNAGSYQASVANADGSRLSSNAVLTVTAQADVRTTMTGPDTVFATSNFTYTITVTNRGPSTATNVLVTGFLPAGLAFVGAVPFSTNQGGGPGQVVFGNASSNENKSARFWTHATPNGTNQLMLVGLSLNDGQYLSNLAVSAVSYGGFALTRVFARTNGLVASELWQLLSPPVGTNPVTVTLGGTPDSLVAGAATFSGVDQADPLGDVGSATGAFPLTFLVLSSATNALVFDLVVNHDAQKPTLLSGGTTLWNDADSGGASAAGVRSGANFVSLSWGVHAADWVHLGVSINPAGTSGSVGWAIDTLASGQTTNITVTVAAPGVGTYTNVVSSAAETPDAMAGNNNGNAASARVVTSVVPGADLVTTLSGPGTVTPLTNYTYTVTVSNRGPFSAHNVVVTETLAPTLTFIAASSGGTFLPGMVVWPALAGLDPGTATNYTVTVRSPLGGTLTNTVSNTSGTADPNASNNDGGSTNARVVTAVSPLQVDNTSKGAGSVSSLTWSHTNGSTGILIVGVSLDSTNVSVTSVYFKGNLPLTKIGETNGAKTKVVMYRLLNPPVGTFPVAVTLDAVAGIVGGAVSFNGVNQANPIAAFVGTFGTGSVASITVPSTLGGVVVDTVAPATPLVAAVPGPGQSLEWNLPGTNVVGGTNYSGAGSSSPGAPQATTSWTLNNPTNWAMAAVALNPATVLADIALAVTGPASVVATSNLTYTVAVTNWGSATASNLVVSDVLPPGTVFVGASGGGTTNANAGVVTWPALTNFVNGARTNYTVTVQAPVGGILTNLAYGTATTADPDPSNNNGAGTGNRVVTTVTPLADVAATVTGPAGVLATANFVYAVTVTNAGPSTASGVVVNSFLPAGATFVGASDGGTLNSGVVTWSLAGLPSGAVMNLTATVAAPAGGVLTNIVAGTSSAIDQVPANNDGSAAGARVLTTVYPLPLLTAQPLPGGGYRMEFDTLPGATVSILASTDLVDWVVLTTTNSGAGHVVFIDLSVPVHPQRFYRSSQ